MVNFILEPIKLFFSNSIITYTFFAGFLFLLYFKLIRR